jgi:hypothetical protein
MGMSPSNELIYVYCQLLSIRATDRLSLDCAVNGNDKRHRKGRLIGKIFSTASNCASQALKYRNVFKTVNNFYTAPH